MSGANVNVLLVAFLIALLIGIIKGYKKGFLRIMVSLACLVIVVLIVTKISPYLSEYLINNTNVYESVRQKIITAYAESKLDEQPVEEIGEKPDFTIQTIPEFDVESLDVSEILAGALVFQNTEDIYNNLSVEIFNEYISGHLAKIVIKAGCFCGLFVVLGILMVCVLAAVKVLEKIPVLRTFNRLMGILAGGGMVVLLTWVFFIAIMVFFYDSMGKWLLTEVKDSIILTYLFKNNQIFKIILR